MIKKLLQGVIFALLTTNVSHAALLFSNYTGESTTTNTRTIGTEFTVGSTPLVVDSLGFYDEGGDGLSSTHEVGIWRVSDNVLIGSATVPAGTTGTLIEDWRFVDVTPFGLDADTTYRIGGLVTGDPDPFGGSFSSSSLLSSTTSGSVISTAESFTYPNNTQSLTRGVVNANVNAAAVPEPTSLLTLGMIAIGGAAYRVRRRRNSIMA